MKLNRPVVANPFPCDVLPAKLRIATLIRFLATSISSLLLAACVMPVMASKISALRIGMTREEVIASMGPPASVSAQGQIEYLNYALSETGDDAFVGRTKQYFVRIIDGRVESYGRTGDFDSTRTPTLRIENDSTIQQNIKVNDADHVFTELEKLKSLLDAGTITEAEFSALKQRLIEKQ